MIKFWILAGVSSQEQTEENNKDSIPDQLKTCRASIAHFGGVEAGCSIFDGYSRTGYEGLQEARQAIPAFNEVVEAADAGRFDTLIVDNWDRLGGVAVLLKARLDKHKIQIYSARQSGRLFLPGEYDPDFDESGDIDMHIQGIIQSYRIKKLRRGYKLGMPKRVKDGLTPSRIPYGYVYVNTKTPPTLDPELHAKLLKAREMLLDKKSYQSIGEFMGVDRSKVPVILSNPFYVGVLSYNKTVVNHAGKRKRYEPQPRSKWTLGEGKHAPAFTQDEHESILAEVDRRYEVYQNHVPMFPFQSLIKCGVCGDRARRLIHGRGKSARWVVVCREHHKKHFMYEYADFERLVINAIVDELRKVTAGDAVDEPDRAETIKKALAEKQKRRRKVQEGYEGYDGVNHFPPIYTAAEAAKLLKEIDKEAEALDRDIERIARAKQQQSQGASTQAELLKGIKDLPYWILNEKPPIVNKMLLAWLKDIQLFPQDKIVIVKR